MIVFPKSRSSSRIPTSRAVSRAWSPIEGSALADGIDAELVRDLYAAWSEHYVRRGYFRQYVHAAVEPL